MSARPVEMRFDPAARVVAGHDLTGVRVTVRRVRDARTEEEIGRHRDGLARVTQYPYVAAAPLDGAVRATFESTLREARASVVPEGQPADLVFDIDVVHISLTTDGMLAGEETFGEVALRVAAFDGEGRALTSGVYKQPFADEDHADPGLLGDAVHKLCGTIVSSIRRVR
jgi:hypothetical protein